MRPGVRGVEYFERDDFDPRIIKDGGYFRSDLHILDDESSTFDVDTVYKLLASPSNRDVMLGCFFDLIYTAITLRYNQQKLPNEVMTRDVLCALSWHLPLHPWSEIHISAGFIHFVFSPSSSALVRYRYGVLGHAHRIFRICCSHIKRICAYDRQRSFGADIGLFSLAKNLEQQRGEAFGKGRKKDAYPGFTDLKNKLFTSWSCPVKQVSLLFMREIGEVYVSQTLIENVLRCEISLEMYRRII